MGGLVKSQPTVEPVSLDEVYSQIHDDSGDEDALLEVMIGAARGWAEDYTGRLFIQRSCTLTLDEWPKNNAEIILPVGPLVSVEAISYVANGTGATTAWSSELYQVDAANLPPRIKPKYGQSYPSLQPCTFNAATVTFTAGMANSADVLDKAIKQAVLLLVGHWYTNREAVVVGSISQDVKVAASALLFNYRVW